MREATGTTWTFQIMVFLILIFAGFLILVINYYRAYIVKNESLKIIEKYDGVTTESMRIINNYIKESGYKRRSKCPAGWYGVDEYDNLTKESSINNKNYLYCYRERGSMDSINDKEDTFYTEVIFFYKFNLPVLGDFMTYRVKGRTNDYRGVDGRYN